MLSYLTMQKFNNAISNLVCLQYSLVKFGYNFHHVFLFWLCVLCIVELYNYVSRMLKSYFQDGRSPLAFKDRRELKEMTDLLLYHLFQVRESCLWS